VRRGKKQTTTCNIGCGSDKWGDIRVEVSRKPMKFHLQKGKTSTANLIADVTHLPFVDKCFEQTRCYQVLEHVKNWRQGLKETCRVSKKVDITVPCVSHVAKNEWKFILGGTLDYVSQKVSSNKNCSLGVKNLDDFLHLPEISRDHLWQFNPKILEKELHRMNFTHVNVETTYHNILRILRLKHSWRITAF